MKNYLTICKEFAIICGIYLLGESVSRALSLTIPGSVTGMLLLTVLLLSGILKLEHVEVTAKLLLDNMGLFFVPAGVGIMAYFYLISAELAAIALITIISTVVVLAVTGLTVEWVAERTGKGDRHE